MTAPPIGEWADQPAPADPAAEAPALLYPTLDRWVLEWLSPTYRRQLGHGRTWCPQWWRHPEAIVRLEALWRSWEHYRLPEHAALGMSLWWRDHADPHLAVLMDPDGPFTGCTVEEGHKPRLGPLRCDHPPPGLFGG